MSDSNENTSNRPNANYKLSKEKTREDELVFYYNRDRRLEKASQEVRDIYRLEGQTRFNLFKPLINTKPKRAMLVFIALLCIVILALSIFGYASDTYSLEGNELSIMAIKYDGAVILALRKTVKKNILMRFNSVYTGAVDIAVSPALKSDSNTSIEDIEVFYQRIFFSMEPEENYRFSVPFDAVDLLIVIKTEKKTISTTIKPE